MKLYYYRDPLGNFGDDLNPWLWPHIAPDLVDDRDDQVLVGIGTLLNHRLPPAPVKHVMGSGLGYGSKPQLDGRFRFHAVRGFETARELGLPASCVVSDAAVLVRRMPLPQPAGPRTRAGVVFTGHTLGHFDWESVCHAADLTFISCHWSVERVLAEMRRCDVILAEAMHGAIVADALRIPWVPIACSDNILAFKWRDWLSSVGLSYEPQVVTTLYGRRRSPADGSPLKTALKQAAGAVGYWSSGWGERPRPPSSARDVDAAAADLRRASQSRTFLSADARVEQHVERFLELLAALQTERSD